MIDLFRAIVLGIIEGLTEFLPVSSTGHMILAMPVLGVQPDQPPWKSFLYFIQIGAILAVIFYFWRRLWPQVIRRPADGLGRHLLVKLVVASIPAAAIGLPINHWVEAHLETPVFVAVALVVGAGVMELIERKYRREGTPPVAHESGTVKSQIQSLPAVVGGGRSLAVASSPEGAEVGSQGRKPLVPAGAAGCPGDTSLPRHP
jgi:undecaprenyl-diphosphatase